MTFPDAARVRLYADWPYVLIEAGSDQPLAWRSHATGWNRSLPDLVFPANLPWLSSPWDDEWRCLGRRASLIGALQQEPQLDVRRVCVNEDAIPPGQIAQRPAAATTS